MGNQQLIQIVQNSIVIILFLIAVGLVFARQKRASRGFLDSLKDFNTVRDELESVIADFVAGIVPWLAGIVPAYISAKHAYTVLQLPLIICVTLGIVVEGVAFANVATYTEVAQFRREKEGVAKYEKGLLPKWQLIAVLAFYLVIVLTMNGLLGFFNEVPMQELYTAISTGNNETLIVTVVPAMVNSFVILLISLLTIPGAATISLRLQHRQFVEEKTRRREKPEATIEPKQESIQPADPQPQPVEEALTPELEKLYNIIRKMVDADREIKKTTLSKITGVSRTTIYNRLDRLVELGKIKIEDGNILLP